MGFLKTGTLRTRGEKVLGGYLWTQARAKIAAESRSYKDTDRFDLFLSHRFVDYVQLEGLVDILRSVYSLTVYVDSEVDPFMDRASADRSTGELIRKRMRQCTSLVYAQTENSEASKWMPWECGYFDGIGKRVAILPIRDFDPASDEYVGTEYLGIYPWINERKTKNGDNQLFVWESKSRYLGLYSWCKGVGEFLTLKEG